MSEVTKVRIARELYHMLETTTIDKITVTELISRSGVSRSTFYYHFQDINDLLEWAMIHHFSRILGQRKTYSTWTAGFLRILEELYAEKEILLKVVDYIDRSVLEKALYDPVYQLLYDVLEEKAQQYPVEEDKKKFIANFYKFGFVGLVINWMENGFVETPVQLSDNLSHLMRGTFVHALEEYRRSEE